MISLPRKLITNILSDCTPSTLLSIGENTKNALQDYLQTHPDCNVTSYMPQEALSCLHQDTVFDFALVANTLEHLEPTPAANLLADLRDIHSRKLVVAVPIGRSWPGLRSYWEETDLLAFGFILKSVYKIESRSVHVYAFDIQEYKTTPDWLSNKHWANPENWDKYWW